MIDGGVLVGIGGSAAHPSGLATITQIAAWHQDGSGNNPKREIIVEPPPSVIDGCAKDMGEALEKM